MVCGIRQIEFSNDIGADFIFQGFEKYDLNFADFLMILLIFEMHFVPISLLLINMYMGDELLRSLEIKYDSSQKGEKNAWCQKFS